MRNLSKQQLQNTKAIVPVHYAGVPCEMDVIMEIAKAYNLLVIEDAAQGISLIKKASWFNRRLRMPQFS